VCVSITGLCALEGKGLPVLYTVICLYILGALAQCLTGGRQVICIWFSYLALSASYLWWQPMSSQVFCFSTSILVPALGSIAAAPAILPQHPIPRSLFPGMVPMGSFSWCFLLTFSSASSLLF
jgi:hypothetical protein